MTSLQLKRLLSLVSAGEFSLKEAADQVGVSYASAAYYCRKHGLCSVTRAQYAIYDNRTDDILFMGTAKECAAFLGVKVDSVYWYCARPDRLKRRTVVRVEEES